MRSPTNICGVFGSLLLITALANAADGDDQIEMFDKDGRVIYASRNSKFQYQTLLPGEYNRVEAGMYSLPIANGNCSTPLFECYLSKYNNYNQRAEIKGTMNSGLKKITFLSENHIPVVILLYTDHLWPEIKSHTFQDQYQLPLVTNAKSSDVVTLTFYILHMSLFSAPVFQVLTSSKGELAYDVNGTNNLTNYPSILNVDASYIALHAIVKLTVKKWHPVDYYSVQYNGQYNTRVIVWDKDTHLQKYNLIEDWISLLPLSDLIGIFIGSAGKNSYYGSIFIVVSTLYMNLH